MDRTYPIMVTVNGTKTIRQVAARLSLADFLREELELKGTHVGCELGVCGACTVLVDGRIMRSCLMFAVQADGCRVDTIEGLSDNGELVALQHAFHELNALQCGFCTAGMLITALAFLRRNPSPTREQIREGLSGNYCRCTGYHAIVEAIEKAAVLMREGKS